MALKNVRQWPMIIMRTPERMDRAQSGGWTAERRLFSIASSSAIGTGRQTAASENARTVDEEL